MKETFDNDGSSEGKFNPLINRLSSTIALKAFVISPATSYYEVIQGLYTVAKDMEPGVQKLKVKKKYGI